ncbi:restriction endonuclease subunit S [Prevotella sp.]|uniref:restriction endonuclease subunit S n=1 Tax=Prevotella sp. TaxID=59823 RepID=UPI0040292F4A
MKLNDIAEFVTDKISSSSISLDRYVTTDSLLQNRRGREIAQNLPPVPCALTHYKQGDVLVANIRPYLKKVWYADSEGGCSSDVLVFRAKNGHCPPFLYTVLMQDAFFDYAMSGAKGSKMPRGDKDQIMRYELPTFTPMEEENIGNMMVDIMSKININRQINDNLEAMAKQLYDYWFVQFDFPNEEGKPYKSSGGAMVWNEKLKREIPSCFEVVNMGNLCDFRNGINYSKDETGNDYQIVNVRNISSSRILLDGEDFDVITVPTSKAGNYVLKPDDIIIARSGCPGSTRLLLSPANTLFCGFIICCSPNDSSMRNYLVYCLKQLEGTNATTSGGSILQNVSQDTLKGLHVIVPQKQIIDKFNKTIELIFARMLNCLKESKALTKQRDELLPLLMNGQATVNYHLSAC